MLGKFLAGFVVGLHFFAVQPSTSNYMLHDYGFGNGGGSTGTANYSLDGITGELSGQDMSTANYGLGSGLEEVRMANVPTISLGNPSAWTNRLQLVLDPQSNPSDALFAIAISTDNFVTTNYVQNDGTVGPALGMEDYQTYTTWGGGSGSDIIGLTPNTTYQVKAKAFTGEFTESGYGPTSSAATTEITLTFDIDVSAIDTETASPYAVNFGDLLPGTVTDGPSKVWLDLATNAGSGARVFILSANAGLVSTHASYTITSATGNLSVLSEGFGARGDTVTQSSGGPLAFESPYNGASNNVGIIDGSYRSLVSSTAALAAGRSSMILKAKATATTPAATDYADLYTLVAAASF